MTNKDFWNVLGIVAGLASSGLFLYLHHEGKKQQAEFDQAMEDHYKRHKEITKRVNQIGLHP